MTLDTLASLYDLELLYPERPSIDRAALLAELRLRLGRIDPLAGDLLAFVAHDFPVAPQDGVAAAVVFMAISADPFDPADARASLAQTWNWPGAGEAVRQARYTLTLADMLARPLAPQRRWHLVRGALSALMSVAPPVAIHWTPAQKMVPPTADLTDPLLPVNARLFRAEGRPHGECLMDTVGLHLLGLPDLQCHFVGLEPDHVAAYLLNIAKYLLEHGQVIGHGHTVAGLGQGPGWQCTEESAMVSPPRPVLSIRPNPPYAAYG